MDVLVVGGGVAGLGSALALARQGHGVTILERDATPLPATAEEAFTWDRRGAPQVRHSHAFLARLRNLLRDRFPDVLAALLAVGATEVTLADLLPEGMDRTSRPGDEDLVLLASRRTTFEWVLRRAVLSQPGVEVRDGVAVTGLAVADGRVVGVTTAGGATLGAEATVAATGPRGDLPAWIGAAGLGDVPEEVEETGIVYWSRFYRLAGPTTRPPARALVIGDLGYLKFALFAGDNDTFSVTLATPVDDGELRGLARALAFDAVAATLEPIAPWIDPDTATPITAVHAMARLTNRHRRFVVDGRPVAPGLHAVGDASVCTNPFYGRGCSLAMVHATLLADVLRDVEDPVAAAVAFEAATDEHLVPWYLAAVVQDGRARRVASGDADESEAGMSSLMRDGLLAATRTDPVVLRAFLRGLNLLDRPDRLLADPDLLARVMATWERRHERPPAPPMGPDRAELLEHIRRAA